MVTHTLKTFTILCFSYTFIPLSLSQEVYQQVVVVAAELCLVWTDHEKTGHWAEKGKRPHTAPTTYRTSRLKEKQNYYKWSCHIFSSHSGWFCLFLVIFCVFLFVCFSSLLVIMTFKQDILTLTSYRGSVWRAQDQGPKRSRGPMDMCSVGLFVNLSMPASY